MNAILSLCHFCELHGPRILFCTQPFRPRQPREAVTEELETNLPHCLKSASVSSNSEPPSSLLSSSTSSLSSQKEVCEGCRSVRTGFVSHDEEAEVSYVSTQQPYNPEVFIRIRQACIRSLSCEVCPGREGPIFFGDEQCGQVLSYTFYIPDCQARGLNRWYSIMVVMMDKMYLLNSWTFLVPHICSVIGNLQKKAKVVFDQEEAKCPQRQYRMAGQVDPTNFMKQRGGNKPARSLPELTGDKHIFNMLHVSFLWILKVCGNRITETILEGPPTEDSIIDMEKQEETEEGFIKIYMRKVNEGDMQEDVLAGKQLSEGMNLGEEDSKSEDCEDDLNCPVINNLRQLRKLMGESNFFALAHHIVIGNQVIVSGQQSPLVKSVLGVLKGLLPKGCCRIIPYSHVYEESWRCNFLGLGLSPGEALPHHVNSTEQFVLVEILPKEQNSSPLYSSSAGSGPDSDFSETNEDEGQIIDNYKFMMSSPVVLPTKVPTVLKRMMLALSNKNLSLDVVESCLICLKEEWMNKVKVLFKFTKAGGNRSEDDMRKLLEVIGARVEDKQLLKFWMTGLSMQYRTHILASFKQR